MSKSGSTICRLALLAIAIFACSSTATAQITKGEQSAGFKLGYVSKNESAIAGFTYQYAFSDHFRLSPEIGGIVQNKNMSAFALDINAHVPFDFTGDMVAFYPLAGINYSLWNHKYHFQDFSDTHHISRFGLNVGAGFELRCSSKIKLSLEAKYTLMKKYSTTIISAGISYVL